MRNSHKVMLLTFIGVISQAASTLLGMILVRFYSQSSFGTYRQVFLIVDTAIALLAFPPALTYFLPQLSQRARKAMVLQSFAILSGLGAIGAAIVVGVAPILAMRFNNPEIEPLLLVASGHIFLTLVNFSCMPMLVGLGKYNLVSRYQILFALIRFSFLAIGASFRLELFYLFLIEVLISFVQVLATILIFVNAFKGVTCEWLPGMLRKQCAYSVPLALSGIVWMLGKEIDKYFLAVFFTPAIYSIFVVGALEIPFFRQISISLSTVLVPRMVELQGQHNHKNLLALLCEVTRKSALIFVPSCALLFTIAKPLIVILYTEQYSESFNVLRIYSLLVFMRTFNFSAMLQGLGRTDYLPKVTLGFIVVNIVLNYAVINYTNLGIIGPALATVFAYMMITGVYLVVLVRELHCKAADFIPISKLLRTMFAVCPGLMLGWGIEQLVDNVFLLVSLQISVFGVTYLTLVHVLKLYTTDDLELVVGKLQFLPGSFKEWLCRHR